MDSLSGSDMLLIAFAIFSLLGCPLLLFLGLDNMFFNKAWWWQEKGNKAEKRADILFIIFPLLVGAHWAIVAIWFPNLYK